jgi:mobilome CxxCx(11)CxxC protein
MAEPLLPQTPNQNPSPSADDFADCWNRALFAHGTAKAFLRRSERYNAWLNHVALLGLGIPLGAGLVYLAFTTHSHLLGITAVIAGILSIAQGLASLAALVYSWGEKARYGAESGSENLELSTDFAALGRQSQNPPADFQKQYLVLKTKDDARRRLDAQRLTGPEQRYAHRAGLIQDPKHRNCPDCGNY